MNNYVSDVLFPYAADYYMVLPKELKDHDIGKGSLVVEKEYLIYFKEGTPEDIKEKLVKDYARYYAGEKRQRKTVCYE